MGAQKYDFSIEKGVSFKISLTYKDPDNQPIDLTGWCARLIWRDNNNSVRTFITTNTNLDEYKFDINALLGTITLFLPATTTNDLNFATAKYDLELQSPQELYSGGGFNVYRWLYGKITIVNRYSQSPQLPDCTV
jgi:hypothetical protein